MLDIVDDEMTVSFNFYLIFEQNNIYTAHINNEMNNESRA